GVQEREAPLREELFNRVLIFAVAALVLQFGLLWAEGVREWSGRPQGYLFLTVFPAVYLALGFLARKNPFRFAGVFIAIILTGTVPVAAAELKHFEYPQFGGFLMLTIVLSGLLV